MKHATNDFSIKAVRRSKKKQYLLGIAVSLMACITLFCLASVWPKQNSADSANQTAIAHQINVDRLVTAMVETSQAGIPTLAPTVPPIPTDTPQGVIVEPTADPGLLPAQAISAPGADCLPANPIEVARVTSIVDGDTIHVEMNGQEYKVRYIGIDAPESGTGTEASIATAANSTLVKDQTVMMIRDQSNTDRYDRLLRYVVTGNGFINYELVRQGYAIAKDYPPDSACAANLAAAMNEARTNQLGLWLTTATPLPVKLATGIPLAAGAASSAGTDCDPSYPGVCIPPAPPDLDCGDIPYRRFQVLQPDPHNFDRDLDGIGCES